MVIVRHPPMCFGSGMGQSGCRVERVVGPPMRAALPALNCLSAHKLSTRILSDDSGLVICHSMQLFMSDPPRLVYILVSSSHVHCRKLELNIGPDLRGRIKGQPSASSLARGPHNLGLVLYAGLQPLSFRVFEVASSRYIGRLPGQILVHRLESSSVR